MEISLDACVLSYETETNGTKWWNLIDLRFWII